MKKFYFVLLFCFLFYSFAFSAIKYLYNGDTVLYNVIFPFFAHNNSEPYYAGDTIIHFIGLGYDSPTSGSNLQPYFSFSYAMNLLQPYDTLFIIKTDTPYFSNTMHPKSNNINGTCYVVSNLAVLEVTYTQNTWFTVKSQYNSYGLIYDFKNIYKNSYQILIDKVPMNFCYNIYKNLNAYYTDLYYYVIQSNLPDSNYIKNNYFYNIKTSASENAIIRFACFNNIMSNNIFDSMLPNYTLLEIDSGSYAFNNYILNSRSNVSLFHLSDYNPIKHKDNYIDSTNCYFPNINGGILCKNDLIIINNDTYFFNKSDTAGFDKNGKLFFLKYGKYDISKKSAILSNFIYDTVVIDYINSETKNNKFLILSDTNFNTVRCNNLLYDKTINDSHIIISYLFRNVPLILNYFNGSETNTTKVNFNWSNIKGANRIRLQIAYDYDFNDLIDDLYLPRNTENYLFTFPKNGLFFWRIKGIK